MSRFQISVVKTFRLSLNLSSLQIRIYLNKNDEIKKE